MLLASVLFVGALLGLRHNVLVLVPAGFTSASVVFAASIAGGDSIWAMLLVTAFSLVALQLGYLAGAWYSQASAVEEEADFRKFARQRSRCLSKPPLGRENPIAARTHGPLADPPMH